MSSRLSRGLGDEPSPPALDERTSNRLLHALADPVRDHLIELLTGDGPATVAQLAHAVGRSPGSVRHHLDVLEEAGAVERVAEGDESGLTPGAYRATALSVYSDEEWAQLPVPVRRRLFAGTLQRIGGHIRDAMAIGGFDRPDSHVSWIPTSLDAEGHAEMTALLVETYQRVVAIQAASNARRPDGEVREDELQSEIVVLQFLRALTGYGDAAALAESTTVDPARERMYQLTDDLADALPRQSVDWARIAKSVRELEEITRERQSAATRPA